MKPKFMPAWLLSFNLRQGFRNPLNSILPGLVVPLAGILIKSLQKRSEKPRQPSV